MSQAYTVSEADARRRKERDVPTSILKGIDALAVEDAIARAPRSQPDEAGRMWRIGAHVGKMVRQLLFWEGKGEADDFRIHKTAREWYESEAGLTERQLRTAKRIATEEGLVEITVGRRRSDGQKVNYFRLDMWQTARVVVESELENTRRKLEHEGRPKERDRLNKKRRNLERALDDLNMLGQRDSGDSEQGELPDKMSGPSRHFGHTTGEYQENPLYRGKAEPAFAEPASAPKARRKGKTKASPPWVIEAFENSDDRVVRKKAYLGYEWDFREDRRPESPYTWISLGSNEEERERYWKRMKRIARQAEASKEAAG